MGKGRLQPLFSMDAKKANAIKSRAPFRPSRTLRSALRERGKSVGSITYFYSSKNGKDVLFSTELQFACGVLLEADERVKSYEMDTGLITRQLEELGYVGEMPDAVIARWGSRLQFLEIRRSKSAQSGGARFSREQKRLAADAVGADWDTFDDGRVEANVRIFHDWIHVAPVLDQTRLELDARWDFLSEKLRGACSRPTTLGDLKSLGLGSWDVVFSAIFRLVQRAVLSTDLDISPLSPATRVWLRGALHGK